MNPPRVMPTCAGGLVRFAYPAISEEHKTELAEVIAEHARSVGHARAALENFTEGPPAADELKTALTAGA